ncbi:AEC family transporter [Jeotgalibacillus salarius]|uniref:AEC family transporter n=1 Tax=Jeotgalibacillus salarius TaxID=546023 RepID=A0A4Y8LEJ9_9BACL|nr:AEC family transporter [Jeotgalibacillus salarius]TFE00619.1 AEC family transporter [Jeotgalibacillus salarius]
MGFFTVLIPVFLIFGIGYIGQKIIGFDTKALSTMALYLLTPFLTFQVFYEADLNIDYVMMLFYTVVLAFSLISVVYVIGYFRGYSQKKKSGMILASAFMNNGNYGTPLVLFIFGETGMKYAIIIMVLQQILMCTVGVYYAAKGSSEDATFKYSLKEVLRIPIMYSAALGVLLQLISVELSRPLMEAVSMVGGAAIPVVMVILGMQLAKIPFNKFSLAPLSLSLTLRLVVSPVIALLIVLFLPIDAQLKQIMVILAAMPTAANTTMYAIQYETDPDFVSSATLFSTLLSLVTIPFVLYGVGFI